MGTKSETLRDADNGLGCLGKAHDNEPVFVLRAQDVFAPVLVRLWADMVMSLRIDKDLAAQQADKARGARKMADEMAAWQSTHHAKIPD